MADKDLGDEIDTLRASLEKLRREFTDFAGTIQDTAEAETREYARRARRLGESAKEEAFRTAAEMRERGREGVGVAQAQIAEHPLTSILIGFGIGLAVGRLLSR